MSIGERTCLISLILNSLIFHYELFIRIFNTTYDIKPLKYA